MNREMKAFVTDILGVSDPVCFTRGNRCILVNGDHEGLRLIVIEQTDDQITARFALDHLMLDDIDVVRRAFELIEALLRE